MNKDPGNLENENLKNASPLGPSLKDRFGRKHDYLRVSLTDRCNLRCQYCMPPDNAEELCAPQEDILNADELRQLMDLFVHRLGVRKIRLTGGEPTLRRDFGAVAEALGGVRARLLQETEGQEKLKLAMTTNGLRLKKYIPLLRDIGMRSVNMSFDTMVPAKFAMISRRPEEWHKVIYGALEEIVEDKAHFDVKVNVVLIRGVNDDEIGDFVAMAKRWPIDVRFIEFMPFQQNGWEADRMVPKAEIIDRTQKLLNQGDGGLLEALPPETLHDTSQRWKVRGWNGTLGVIPSMTDAFCGGCNRLRLTADGHLRNCLFGEEEWNLRSCLREGTGEEGIVEQVTAGVAAKFARLGGKRDMHELNEPQHLTRPMVALGG